MASPILVMGCPAKETAPYLQSQFCQMADMHMFMQAHQIMLVPQLCSCASTVAMARRLTIMAIVRTDFFGECIGLVAGESRKSEIEEANGSAKVPSKIGARRRFDTRPKLPFLNGNGKCFPSQNFSYCHASYHNLLSSYIEIGKSPLKIANIILTPNHEPYIYSSYCSLKNP